MLWNIIDERTNKFSTEIDAVFEPAWHDNSIDGASQAEVDESWGITQEYNTTIYDAVFMARDHWHTPVTLYLYDVGSRPLDSSQKKSK